MASGIERLAGLNILVVEDQAVVAMEIQSILKALGCKIVGPAATLEDALALILSKHIDGALMDVNLQKKHVVRAVEELARRRVPFILVTSYPELDRDVPILRNAPRVNKPFTREQLTSAMLSAFDRPTYPD